MAERGKQYICTDGPEPSIPMTCALCEKCWAHPLRPGRCICEGPYTHYEYVGDAARA
jgi:hypothetical protein